MTYDELLRLVLSSTPQDWLFHDDRDLYVFKPDLDVTIRRVELDPEFRPKFPEPWAKDFPDPNAYTFIFEVFFRTTFVKSYHFVSVDGHRAMLPFPRAHNDLSITSEQRILADIVNSGPFRDYFERYITRFEVRD